MHEGIPEKRDEVNWESKELSWNSLPPGKRMFAFEIKYSDRDVTGYMEIGFASTSNPELLPREVNERIGRSDVMVAQLNTFRPNGPAANEDMMRHGYGSKALACAIERAREQDAFAMYVFHSGPYMEGFLSKHGFEPLGKFYMYKELDVVEE